MPDPILEIRNLAKSFGTVHAVKDVRFSVPAGKTLDLLGVNGTGKTPS
jgi:ABC-2 type transport system ATP-binding protein